MELRQNVTPDQLKELDQLEPRHLEDLIARTLFIGRRGDVSDILAAGKWEFVRVCHPVYMEHGLKQESYLRIFEQLNELTVKSADTKKLIF